MRIFGLNEAAARIPGALIGTINIYLVFWMASYFTENKICATLAAFFYAFLPWSIGLSRDIRMYIFFQFTIIALSILIYKILENEHSIIIKSRFSKINYLLNNLGLNYKLIPLFLAIFLLSWNFHRLAWNILPGVFIYVLVLFIYNIFQKETTKYLYIVIISILFGSTTLLILDNYIGLKDHIIGIDQLFAFRNTEYFNILYNEYRLGKVITIFGSLILIIKEKKKGLYVVCLFWTSLLLHVYVHDRYVTKRYIAYLLPLYTLIYSYGLFNIFLLVINLTSILWTRKAYLKEITIERIFSALKFKKIANLLFHLFNIRTTNILAVGVILIAVLLLNLSLVKDAFQVPFWEHGVTHEGTGLQYENTKGALLKSISVIEKDSLIISPQKEAVDFYLGTEDYNSKLLSSATDIDEFLLDISKSDGWYIIDYRRQEGWRDIIDKRILNISNFFQFYPELSNETMNVYKWQVFQPGIESDFLLKDHFKSDANVLIKVEYQYNDSTKKTNKDNVQLDLFVKNEGDIIGNLLFLQLSLVNNKDSSNLHPFILNVSKDYSQFKLDIPLTLKDSLTDIEEYIEEGEYDIFLNVFKLNDDYTLEPLRNIKLLNDDNKLLADSVDWSLQDYNDVEIDDSVFMNIDEVEYIPMNEYVKVKVQLTNVKGDHYTNQGISIARNLNILITSGMYLEYSIKADKASDIRASIQGLIDNKPTWLNEAKDQHGLKAAYYENLNPYYVNEWLHRKIPLDNYVGKTIKELYFMINDEPDMSGGGNFNFYFKNVRISKTGITLSPIEVSY